MKSFNILVLGLFVLIFSACSDSDGPGGDGKDGKRQKPRYVNWDSVGQEFNPRVEEVQFETDGVERIYISAFSFDKDVEIVYSSGVQANEGHLKVFKVWKKFASWGNFRSVFNGKKLELSNYGQYSCSISVENGQITSLEGGCYVRIQIFLPIGAEIEVYNIGQLISKRFIPIDAATFLELVKSATWADEKFEVIDQYIASYQGTSKTPALTSSQLGKVIDGFMRGENKLKTLRVLHTFISDRENLGQMIEDEFSHFDQEKARKIVGL